MEGEMAERQFREWPHIHQDGHLEQTEASTMFSKLSFRRVHPSTFSFLPNLASHSFSENVIQISPYIKVLSPLSVPEGEHYVDFLK